MIFMNINDTIKATEETWIHEHPEKYDSKDVEVLYVAACLGGEVGELQNVLKKLFREKYYNRGHAFKGDVKEFAGTEVADIMFYLARVAKLLDIDMEKEFAKKMEINRKRYTEQHEVSKK